MMVRAQDNLAVTCCKTSGKLYNLSLVPAYWLITVIIALLNYFGTHMQKKKKSFCRQIHFPYKQYQSTGSKLVYCNFMYQGENKYPLKWSYTCSGFLQMRHID